MEQRGHISQTAIIAEYLQRDRLDALAPESRRALHISALLTCIVIIASGYKWQLINTPINTSPATLKVTIAPYHPSIDNPLTATVAPAEDTAPATQVLTEHKEKTAVPPVTAAKPRPPTRIQQSTPHPSTAEPEKTTTAPQIAATKALDTSSSEQQRWSNVFDSRLRKQLQDPLQQGASRQGYLDAGIQEHQLQTYRNLDGSQEVQQGNRCFTVAQSDTSPTGLQWSVPHPCKGQLTESDRITRSLQQAMNARFRNLHSPR